MWHFLMRLQLSQTADPYFYVTVKVANSLIYNFIHLHCYIHFFTFELIFP